MKRFLDDASAIPGFAWSGVVIMIAAQAGFALGNQVIATWLTPIMWSGYILFMDGLLYRRQHRSWLTTRVREFPLLVLLSIGIWLIFEVYNFHLQNWLYFGVPETAWIRNLAYAWSFATILPGVFITSELFATYLPTMPTKKFKRFAESPDWLLILTGIAALTIPLALPIPIARYLFAAIWLGFAFLLDPINAKLGNVSLRAHWRKGDLRLTAALLIGGLVCGLLWEAWNFQAFRADGGHWVYTIPQGLRIFNLHYGNMPILGMLGFLPFAIELYALYHFFRSLLGAEAFLGPLDW